MLTKWFEYYKIDINFVTKDDIDILILIMKKIQSFKLYKVVSFATLYNLNFRPEEKENLKYVKNLKSCISKQIYD